MLQHAFELICSLLRSVQSDPHFFPNTFAPRITGSSRPTLGSPSAQCDTRVFSCRNQAATFTQGERGTCAWMTSKNALGRVVFIFNSDVIVDKMWRVLDSTLDCGTLDTSSWCWRRSGICELTDLMYCPSILHKRKMLSLCRHSGFLVQGISVLVHFNNKFEVRVGEVSTPDKL